MISTFHAHSQFDDGKGDLEDYVRSALNKGFDVFGFSAHAPVNFETSWNMKAARLSDYIAETKALKARYDGRIELYTGLETDFYDHCTDWRQKEGIDYTIGAIHFFQDPQTGSYMAFDGSLKEFEESLHASEGSIQKLVATYYGLMRKMLEDMPPNIVAHLDVIRKNNANNRFFDETESWYREEVQNTLEVIAKTGAIVEVNTGGISRGYVTEPYPSPWILMNCLKLGIPVMINSDTHSPETIDCYYPEAADLLRRTGYKTLRVLQNQHWQDVAL